MKDLEVENLENLPSGQLGAEVDKTSLGPIICYIIVPETI